MKVNIFLFVISIALAALIGYWVYIVAEGKESDIVCGIGSGLCFAVTMISFGLQFEDVRIGVNVRILSALFFILFLVSNFCFAKYGIDLPYYIIITGIVILIFMGLIYKIQGTKDV